jgi:hypothetical protein
MLSKPLQAPIPAANSPLAEIIPLISGVLLKWSISVPQMGKIKSADVYLMDNNHHCSEKPI